MKVREGRQRKGRTEQTTSPYFYKGKTECIFHHALQQTYSEANAKKMGSRGKEGRSGVTQKHVSARSPVPCSECAEEAYNKYVCERLSLQGNPDEKR